jgi:N-acetylneuraminic acid mutarotase
VWTGSRMLVWGGGTNTGAQYDPATDTWTPITTTGAPSARSGSTAVWAGSRMLVWGGFDVIAASPTNTGAQYDPATDTWVASTTMGAPSSGELQVAVSTGSRMLVWGGHDASGQFANTGAQYDPATDTWTPITTAGAPSARATHTAVWTGSRMLVWGGALTNTGGRYLRLDAFLKN